MIALDRGQEGGGGYSYKPLAWGYDTAATVFIQ